MLQTCVQCKKAPAKWQEKENPKIVYCSNNCQKMYHTCPTGLKIFDNKNELIFDDDDIVGLESNDGIRIKITKEQAKEMNTIKDALEDSGPDDYIPLTTITGEILLLLEKFIKNKKLLTSNYEDNKFLSLLSAANYLDFESLLLYLMPEWVNTRPFPGANDLKGLISKALFFYEGNFAPFFAQFDPAAEYTQLRNLFIPFSNRTIELAARHGHLNVVDRLLENWRINPSNNQDAAFIEAAQHGHLNVVDRLLQDRRVNPSSQNNRALSLPNLHEPIAIRILQDSRIDPVAGDNIVVITAARYGQFPLFQRLLQIPGVDPTAKNNLAIRFASANGHFKIVQRLLMERNVDPTADDNAAIQMASENNHTDVVRLLLNNKRVDPTANDNYAIRWASQKGHTEVVKLLLNDGRADPAAKNNYAIRTASEYGRTEVVRLLLNDKHVDPVADNNYAIRKASEYGRTEIVRLLLNDRRADPAADNNYAIRRASEKGRTEIVRLLLNDGRADPAAKNNYAIRTASEYGRTEIVRLLLNDRRADPTAEDNAAIRTASQNGHPEVVRLLLEDDRIDPTGLLEYSFNYPVILLTKLLLEHKCANSEDLKRLIDENKRTNKVRDIDKEFEDLYREFSEREKSPGTGEKRPRKY